MLSRPCVLFVSGPTRFRFRIFQTVSIAEVPGNTPFEPWPVVPWPFDSVAVAVGRLQHLQEPLVLRGLRTTALFVEAKHIAALHMAHNGHKKTNNPWDWTIGHILLVGYGWVIFRYNL